MTRFILLLIAIAGLSGPISARTVRSGTPQVYRSYRPARVTIAVEDKETKDPLIGVSEVSIKAIILLSKNPLYNGLYKGFHHNVCINIGMYSILEIIAFEQSSVFVPHRSIEIDESKSLVGGISLDSGIE